MAREQGTILDTGDLFPAMEMTATSGDRLTLPDYFAGRWGILLAYRGHW